MRLNQFDSYKYRKEIPYDFDTYEQNSGANINRDPLMQRLSYTPFKDLIDKINFAEKLKELPERTQNVINYILEGYSQKEIAFILNVSIRTVKREFMKIKVWYKNEAS